MIGIILSGTLGDGSMGLLEIKRAGRATIVQDPDEAMFSGMPSTAIRKTKVNFILPLDAIARKIAELVNGKKNGSEAEKMSRDEYIGKSYSR